MHSKRAALALFTAVLAGALALAPASALAADGAPNDTSGANKAGSTYVGVGAGLFFENSRLAGEEIRAAETEDESYDYNPDGMFNGSLWVTHRLTDLFRVGGTLEYYGSYETMRVPEEKNDEKADDIQAFELGQSLNLAARADVLIPFLDRWQLVLGAEAGLTTLFPDGDFRREIDAMKDRGITVSGGPRLGFVVGPEVGARWQIDRRLALKADFAVQWQRIFLFGVNDNVEGVAYERSWKAKILRYNIGVGMEVTL